MGRIRSASNIYLLDFHYGTNLALSFGHCQNRNGTLYCRGNNSDHTHRIVRDLGYCDSHTLPPNSPIPNKCINLRIIRRIANFRSVAQLQKAIREPLIASEKITWIVCK